MPQLQQLRRKTSERLDVLLSAEWLVEAPSNMKPNWRSESFISKNMCVQRKGLARVAVTFVPTAPKHRLQGTGECILRL